MSLVCEVWYHESMTPASRPDRHMLFDFAHLRRGAFTLADARAAGYSRELVHYHAKAGDFVPVGRGVYRLVDYPNSPEDRLADVAAVFGSQAVISHESALSLYEVSDVIARGIHVTIPREKRHVRNPFPDVVLHTSKEAIDTRDVVDHHGFRATSLARSIAESARFGTDPKLIRQAIRHGLQREILDLNDLRRNLAGQSRRVCDAVAAALDVKEATM